MNKHTVVGAVLAAFMVCIGGCGCVTVEPKPTEAHKSDVSAEADDRTCVSCLEVCYPTRDGALICEEECEGGHACEMHEAKRKADAIRELMELPDGPPPSHQNQTHEPHPNGERTYEL